MATVDFNQATRTYPGTDAPAVDHLDLAIEDGEFLVLVGPSGCGKSTTLRMLAGLEPVNDGSIHIGVRDVTDVPAKERDIAMVFQSYALYPHMTVGENIGFHLKIKRVPKDERKRRVDEAAALLGLEEYLNRKPANLSGGQRQRVAMGRAIVRQPQVFLMDEPLSNLDAKLRVQTRTQIAALQRRLGVTTVYVTHDQVEAMTMGDRVAVLDRGLLQQCASPRELFAAPANLFVAGFIGSPAMNLFPAQLTESGVSYDGVTVPITPEQRSSATSREVTVGVRPDGWDLTSVGGDGAGPGLGSASAPGLDSGSGSGSGSGDGAGISARVEVVEELGTEAFVYCRSDDGTPIVTRAEGMTTIEKGEQLRLRPRLEAVHLFDSATGRRLAT